MLDDDCYYNSLNALVKELDIFVPLSWTKYMHINAMHKCTIHLHFLLEEKGVPLERKSNFMSQFFAHILSYTWINVNFDSHEKEKGFH